jgi:hypothetical protein
MRASVACLSFLTLVAIARGADKELGSLTDEGVYETDRPGELENPFTVPPGGAEVVNYVVGMNAAAREDVFGYGGSAVFVDTAVRFGVANRIEGVVTLDSFLSANPPQGSAPGSDDGFGYTTLLIKWNFLRGAAGDFGVALAPFVRLPLDRAIAGASRSESGLIVPFDIDLEGGWELEGSTSVARAPEGTDEWSTQWENQMSLQRTLTAMLAAYVELDLESGDGLPAWGTEFGVTCQLNSRVLIDLGGSAGIGRNWSGRMTYAGIGWRF